MVSARGGAVRGRALGRRGSAVGRPPHSAFFVEAFVTQSPLARCICALIKPHALAFALLSIARDRWTRWSTYAFLAPLAMWALCDAFLRGRRRAGALIYGDATVRVIAPASAGERFPRPGS